MSRRDVVGALCGVAGPSAFVTAWLVAGARSDGYDPAVEAISRLAAEGAPNRAIMTVGFVAFGVLVPVWAGPVATALGAPALRPVVTTAGLATLAVAALPLTREAGGTQDALHAVAAGIGYAAMALTPLVAAPALRRAGRRRAAAASLGTGALSTAALVGTLVIGDAGQVGSGGLQRLGLTVVDTWHVAVAAWVLRRQAGAAVSPRSC